MASELIRQMKCDRCERIETRPIQKEKTVDDVLPQFDAVLRFDSGQDGIAVTFVDLCGPCSNTITKALESIGKKVEKKSPNRTAAKK